MPTYSTNAFLGNIQLNIKSIKLGNEVANINPFFSPLFYLVRNDEFSSFLELAYPGTLAQNLGMTSYTDDIALVIKNTGNATSSAPTGSGQLYPSSSLVSSGSYIWANNGYQTSLFISGAQNLTSIPTQSLGPFGSQNFVFEGWFNYQSPVSPSIAPFNQFFFGNVSGDSILMDIAGTISSNYRFSVTPGGFNTPSNYKQNIWYHVAYVRNGSDFYIYLNGQRIGNSSTVGGNINFASGQTDWDVLGSAGINDGAAKLAQDVRLYIGTNKNYTASVITPPESMLYLG